MKEFLKLFSVFDINLNRTSYKSPLIRVIVSLIIMFGTVIFRLNVTIKNPILNIVLAIILLAVVVLSVLCFFVAAVECLQVSDNRKNMKKR